MSQTIKRVTIERLQKIKALEIGKFILISDNARSARVKIRGVLYKAQTVGYLRYSTLNIPATWVYHIFECRGKLYIARVK